MPEYDGLLALERLERAVLKVRKRLLRATGALGRVGVPYAVVGDDAVAAWVEQVDESAVRFSQNVDLAIRRADLDAAKTALEADGFVYRNAAGMDMFLDGPDAKAHDAVYIVFCRENVRKKYVAPVPDIAESASFTAFMVLDLEALVRMKLTSFRDKDRTHLRDMIDVGLIDASCPARFMPEMSERLQELLDTPEG